MRSVKVIAPETAVILPGGTDSHVVEVRVRSGYVRYLCHVADDSGGHESAEFDSWQLKPAKVEELPVRFVDTQGG